MWVELDWNHCCLFGGLVFHHDIGGGVLDGRVLNSNVDCHFVDNLDLGLLCLSTMVLVIIVEGNRIVRIDIRAQKPAFAEYTTGRVATGPT